MDVLEKTDAKAHRPFVRDKGLPASRPMSGSGRTDCLMIKPEMTGKNSTRFAEDFYWEHSLTRVSLVLTAIPNSSKSVRSVTRRSHHTNNINLPNCVYVG